MGEIEEFGGGQVEAMAEGFKIAAAAAGAA